MKTKKTEKQKKPTTFLVPPGRFSPEVKTAAKTLLKPYVLKLEKKRNTRNVNHCRKKTTLKKKSKRGCTLFFLGRRFLSGGQSGRKKHPKKQTNIETKRKGK